MEIFRGQIKKPLRVVIYGPEGIGKSTFAAQFPAPLFIDTEGSTDHMDVFRYPRPSSWTMLLQEIDDAKRQAGQYSTLVIDTADWAEALCKEHVVRRANVQGIEDFGYGKGYVYVAEEWGRMLNKLSEVLAAGMNVVLTAHAAMRKFEQPDEMGAYDRWELKLEKREAQMVKEWADMVLFANYEVHAVKTSDSKGAKAKAQGGRRVMYTTHHACWDAKNRQGLAEKLPFAFSEIAGCVPSFAAPQNEELPFTFGEDAPPHGDADAPVEPNIMQRLAERVSKGNGEQVAAPPTEPHIDNPGPAETARAGISPDVPKALADLMAGSGVTEEQVRGVIAQKGYYPADTSWEIMERDGFVDGWVVAFWDKIVDMIRKGA